MQIWKDHKYDFEPRIQEILKESKIQTWLECGNFSQAPTGEPYLTVTSGGVKPEGEPAYYYPEKKQAIATWFECFKAFCQLSGSGYNLYWRRKPFLAEIDGKFSVFSRFLISDKPVIQDADYNNNLK
jgi:hypothetical protein